MDRWSWRSSCGGRGSARLMPERCRVGLERNGQPAAQLSDHGGGGERRQAANLAAEMGLVGIARRQCQRRQLRLGRPSGEVEKALETEDAVQPLRAVAEGLVAAPAQAALA